jgi:hypothetical protein
VTAQLLELELENQLLHVVAQSLQL